MGKVGKRTKKSLEAFSGKSNVTIEEAVKLVKSNATAKFDETIEIAMNLGVDTRHADQMVRGVVGLPNGTGKSSTHHHSLPECPPYHLVPQRTLAAIPHHPDETPPHL